MRLSVIEVVVGEPSEKLPTFRHLSYRVSFKDEAGEECQQQHESLMPERAVYDSVGIARIVAHVVRGLLMDYAGPDARTEVAEPGCRAPGAEHLSRRTPFQL
jgi:hypothetical protein